MLPNKSHLQLIVKELEKFDSDLETSYNFQEFIDRCRVIFPVSVQEELDFQLFKFEEDNIIDTLTAQGILYQVKVRGMGGRRVLRITKEDGSVEKVPLNLNKLEYGLRRLVVWCRKQVIRLIKDEQVDFERMSSIDLEGAEKK